MNTYSTPLDFRVKILKPRHDFTCEQKNVLLKFFEKVQFPSSEEKLSLARELNLSCRNINNWFVNKRRQLREDVKITSLVARRPQQTTGTQCSESNDRSSSEELANSAHDSRKYR